MLKWGDFCFTFCSFFFCTLDSESCASLALANLEKEVSLLFNRIEPDISSSCFFFEAVILTAQRSRRHAFSLFFFPLRLCASFLVGVQTIAFFFCCCCCYVWMWATINTIEEDKSLFLPTNCVALTTREEKKKKKSDYIHMCLFKDLVKKWRKKVSREANT